MGKVTLLLLLSVLTVEAQPTFRSAELKRLAKVLQVNTDSIRDGYNSIVRGNRTVKILSNNGQVDFMGYDIFPDDLKALAHTPIFNFLERYFLQLDYPQADRPRERMMREDRFRFETGSLQTVQAICPDDNFAYNYEDKRYVATWTRNDETLLSVSFPADHELISGENKIEAEKNVEADIQATAPRQPKPVSEGVLTATVQPGYYVQKGSTYISDMLTADLYYRQHDGGYTLVGDADHPLESAANLMLSPQSTANCNLQVKQVMYGYKKKQFCVPVRQWIAYCLDHGCQMYYGTESMDKGVVKATVIAVNTEQNYNHVLFVNIPLEVIESGRGDIEAHLDAFIPMHNVLNLFGKYQKKKYQNPKLYE